jgi:hypothetical protein
VSDGDPDIEPHLLLTIQAHALSADYSATVSAPGLLSYCVPAGRDTESKLKINHAQSDVSSFRLD